MEVEVTDSIATVKEKVEQAKPDLPAARQKLIHSGKVLKDETILSETGISENDFIVCMVTKEAAAAKPKPAAPVAPATPAAAPPAPAPQAAAPAPAPSTPATPASGSQPAVPPAVSRGM